MHEYLDDLYEMCETVAEEISHANDKIREADGKLSGSDVDYIDKLTHALKSIKTTVAMIEADDGGWSGDNGSMGGYGGSYARGRRDYSRDGGSYARGRGRSVRRDSMGRYSRDGYSRDSKELANELRDVMRDVTDERTRQKLQKFVGKLEEMD